MIMQVDIEKAFDTIHLNFVEAKMQKMGLEHKMSEMFYWLSENNFNNVYCINNHGFLDII